MGYRYPKQKTTVQPRNPYGAMQPQSQKSTAFALNDQVDLSGMGGLDIDKVNEPVVPLTPEQQQTANDNQAAGNKHAEDLAKVTQNGSSNINPLHGMSAKFGKPSKEQMEEAIKYYQGQEYGYDPYQQDRAGMFREQDFNPYRLAAGNKADAGNAMESQGAYNQLVQQGPASASDRMQLASDFNRRKITGAFAAGGAANERENQGAIQTGQQNISRGMDVDAANAGAQNTMMRFKEGANENRRLNLYRTKKEQELLDKKLAVAAKISGVGGYGGDAHSQYIKQLIEGS